MVGSGKIVVIAIIGAFFLTMPGCGGNGLDTQTNPDLESSLDLTVFSQQTDTFATAAEAASDTTAASTDISIVIETSPITAADIISLPAGSIIDEFVDADNEEIIQGCFYSAEISDEVFARMKGKSYKDDCTVPLSELRYVRVLYFGFDSRVRTGELVVNMVIAQDIIEIFKGLYEAEYQIGKMVLVDEYNADDNASMADNNTSAFNYRRVVGTTKLSKHAQGMAIDINPLYNPWIYMLDGQKVVDPPESILYEDRSSDNIHFIDHDDLCYKLFVERGFAWGGDWESSKDYQHFSMTA